MASLTLKHNGLIKTISISDAKFQALLDLALPEWGYPPPQPTDADGKPIGEPFEDTPQAKLDWAGDELASHLVETARRGKRKQVAAERTQAEADALAGLGIG